MSGTAKFSQPTSSLNELISQIGVERFSSSELLNILNEALREGASRWYAAHADKVHNSFHAILWQKEIKQDRKRLTALGEDLLVVDDFQQAVTVFQQHLQDMPKGKSLLDEYLLKAVLEKPELCNYFLSNTNSERKLSDLYQAILAHREPIQSGPAVQPLKAGG